MGRENNKLKVKVNRLHVYLTLVFLCAGYLIAFSYHFTQKSEENRFDESRQWEKEDQLREKILAVKKENAQLEKNLQDLQRRVNEKEKEMSAIQKEVSISHQDLASYRLVAGLIESEGPGVEVLLDDSSFASESQNPNDYIIHEQDVRRVVNELFAAGAEGITINGQRLIHSSAIRCVGPTIIVNNVKSAAPFKIKAVGDPNTLYQALLLPGGVVDSLKSWGINIKIEKEKNITLSAYIGEL